MIIGVTGGIATGKSTVAKFLKEYRKAEVINVDKLGWKILDKKKKELAEAFGKEILTKGRMDRKKLGKLVFNNKRKLNLLNSIVHPMLIRNVKNIIKDTPPATIKIIDCALIYEWKIEKLFDKIILVTSDYKNKIKRIKRLKYDKGVVNNIIKSQLKDSIKPADIIIKNNSDLKNLKLEVKKQSANIFD